MSEIAEAAVEGFAAEAGTVPVVNVQGVDAPAVTTTEAVKSKFYTEEDLAKVRTQEKDKLYPTIEKLKEQVDVLTREREEQSARLNAEAEEKNAQLRAQQEEELSAKDLLKLKESEWKEQLERERQERERAFALLEQEKAFADIQSFRQQLLEQERENIIPELVDLISGSTREELQSSVESLKDRSSRILESAQSAMQNARREMTGTRVTTPPAGPLETQTEQRNFTAQEIASMSVDEYAKYRSRLLSPQAQGKTSGLFG
jgi:DNA repair exonuclease SbcCD ATPase subunit